MSFGRVFHFGRKVFHFFVFKPNKLIFNLMSKVQSIEEEKTGRQAPHKPSIKVRLSTPKAAMGVLSEFIESWDSMK